MVKKEGGKVVWQVVKEGNLVREYNEEEIRFTISCKFHLFRSEQEADQFYSGKGAKLTAESILDGLVRCKPFSGFTTISPKLNRLNYCFSLLPLSLASREHLYTLSFSPFSPI